MKVRKKMAVRVSKENDKLTMMAKVAKWLCYTTTLICAAIAAAVTQDVVDTVVIAILAFVASAVVWSLVVDVSVIVRGGRG